MHFDLRTEPWIPVETLDGAVTEVGIRDALVNAHVYNDLRPASPLQYAALLRLLLAVLYAAHPLGEDNEWVRRWNLRRIEPDVIDAYLHGPRCANAFDLFSETQPFLQVAGMTSGNAVPLAALALETATGNNATLFDHAVDTEPPTCTPAAAARMLLAAQAFALGFGKSSDVSIAGALLKRPYLADAPCLRGVTLCLSANLAPDQGIEANGGALFRTLLLNLAPYPAAGTPKDPPVWERDALADVDRVASPRRLSTGARGPVDRYVWRSRLVRLLPEADGTVRRAYVAQGREADKSAGDPMKVYVQDKKEGVYAQGLRADKATWRDLHVYLGARATTAVQCPILSHVARHVRRRVLPAEAMLCLNAIGMATDPGKAGKFLLWRHERISLPGAVMVDADAVEAVRLAIDDAEYVAATMGRRLYQLAWHYLPPDGNPDEKDVRALADALDTRADLWARVAPAFARFLHALPGSAKCAKEDWRKTLAAEAGRALRQACDRLGHSARAIRARAHIATGFIANRAEAERRQAEAKAATKQRKGTAV